MAGESPEAVKTYRFWDTIRIDLPANWTVTRKDADGSGAFLVDSPGEVETLWVDYELLRHDCGDLSKTEMLRELRSLIAKLPAEFLAHKAGEAIEPQIEFLEENDALFSCRLAEKDDQGPVQRLYLLRFRFDETRLLVAQFNFYTPWELRDAPLHSARAKMIALAVRDAVVAFPAGVDG